MLREQIGLRKEFISNMIKGNNYLKAIKAFLDKATDNEEMKDLDIDFEFSLKLSKAMSKYNCPKHWNIEILKVNDEKLDRESERKDGGADIFNSRNQAQKTNVEVKLLGQDSSVKNFMKFRQNNMSNFQK